jgi:hypothetical protein
MRRYALVFALVPLGLWLAGCQNFDINLGAPSRLSSQISYLSPSAAVAGGSQDIMLTVNGIGFVNGSVVQWEKENRVTEFVNATELHATIRAADLATPGIFEVRVISPGPNDGNNFSDVETFEVCPTNGPCLSGTPSSLQAASRSIAGDSYSPAISADRRYIAFAATSADPSTNASPGLSKIFLRDTCDGGPEGCAPATILVSRAWHGGEPNAESRSPAISADGRFVAFASDASDLLETDSNDATDVFLADTCVGAPEGCTPSTVLISVGLDGAEANGPSTSPTISADGRFVAFDSQARNLVADGSSAPTGAFVRDTCHAAAPDCLPSTQRLAISSPPNR